MQSSSFFLSNEPYSTSKRQKLTKVQNFKAHTTKNNSFSRIFNRLCSQRGFFLTLKKINTITTRLFFLINFSALGFMDDVYGVFGIKFELDLSTRPGN